VEPAVVGELLSPPVRLVEIPKKAGGVRPLGVPTVADRIAQTVVAQELEKAVEPIFDDDSYGYRPGRSAHDALEVCRQRCWRYDWVVDLDVKAFFDSVDHQLMLKAVAHHTDLRWILLYVQRWLQAPQQQPDGSLVARDRGTPQGSAVSPVLANLFLHYTFDAWMRRTFPSVPFERYADDAIVHCTSLAQAEQVQEAIRQRLVECGLQLHPDKTRIVYCKDNGRPGSHTSTSRSTSSATPSGHARPRTETASSSRRFCPRSATPPPNRCGTRSDAGGCTCGPVAIYRP